MSRPTADEVRSTPMTAPPGIPAGEERSRRSKRPTSEEMHGQAAPPFEPAVPGGKPEPESPAVAKSRRQLEEAQTAERQENAEKAKLERIASYSKRLEVAKLYAAHNLCAGDNGARERIFRDLRRVAFLQKVEWDSQVVGTAVIDLVNASWSGSTIILDDGDRIYIVRDAPNAKDSFSVPASACLSMHPTIPGA